MNDIALIGDKDSVLLGKAAGLSSYGTDPDHVSGLIYKLAKGGVKIIFVTEELYKAAESEIDRYKTKPFPAIIPIPGKDGSMGIGMEGINKNVEKAIGIDIFNE